MNKKNTLVILALILLLGSFLRIYGLGDESFWIDESATAYASQKGPSYIINNIYTKAVLIPEYFPEYVNKGGGEAPLYYILAAYWTKLFGLSEFKLRLLSALFGIMSIYLIFLVGKLLFNTRIGLISAFIIALNHQNIYYSQEARCYSMLVFFTLLSVYFLMRALHENRNIFWFGYSICSIILIYAHYLSFFILMFEYLYIAIFWKSYKKYLKKSIISGLAIFVAYTPWIPVFLRQSMNTYYSYYSLFKPNLYNLASIFVQINSWVSPDFPTRIALRNMDIASIPISGWFLIATVLLITLLLGITFLIGVFKYRKFAVSNIKNKYNVFLLLWFLIPIFVPFVLSIIFPTATITGIVRYVLFATPAYYILASKGISEMRKHYKLILILFVLLSIFPLYSYYSNFDKGQWVDVANYLKVHRQKDEFIIIHKEVAILPLSYYYPIKNIEGVRDVEQAKLLTNGKNSFWLIYASEKYGDSKQEIKKYLDSVYKIDNQAEFVGAKLYHYIKAS